MLRFRSTRPEEFDTLMAFLAAQFGCSEDLFRGMSHGYIRTPTVIGQTHVAVDGDEIVGAYGIFPRRLRLGSAELSAAGIGGVSVREDRRGQGIMTWMIRSGDAMLRNLGIHVACLGGDRFRYREFGWEGGGRRHLLRLTQRSLDRSGAASGPARRFRPQTDLAKVKRAHDALGYRLVRPKAYFERLLRRPGIETVVSDRPRRFAYAIFRSPERIVEGAGHPDGLAAIVRRLLSQSSTNHVNLEIGPERNAMLRWAIQSADYSRPDSSASWQIRILDLRSTLRSLLPELRRRAPRGLTDGRVTLTMTDSGQSATLRYGRRFAVEARPCRVHMRLRDADMARLILGTIPAIEGFALKGRLTDLDAIFPVDWHWPTMDRV